MQYTYIQQFVKRKTQIIMFLYIFSCLSICKQLISPLGPCLKSLYILCCTRFVLFSLVSTQDIKQQQKKSGFVFILMMKVDFPFTKTFNSHLLSVLPALTLLEAFISTV